MIDVRNIDVYKNKGECFVITTYCNTQHKIDILNQTIDNIKQYGLPIFIHAHYPIPNDIQGKVNSYFYSSDNPIFNRFNIFQEFVESDKTKFEMTITEYDHYYTVLKGWDESIKILSDFEKIHVINYDTNLYPELFEVSKRINKSIFLQHNYFARNMPHIFLPYFCITKNNYNFFRENITLDKYLNYWDISKSTFLPHVEELVGSFIVNNDINYIIPYTDYNYSKIIEYDVSMDARWDWDKSGQLDDTKIFIGENGRNASVLFYDVTKTIQFNICVYRKGPFTQGIPMGGETGGSIDSTNLFILEYPMNMIDRLIIKVNDQYVEQSLIKKFFNLYPKIYRLS